MHQICGALAARGVEHNLDKRLDRVDRLLRPRMMIDPHYLPAIRYSVRKNLFANVYQVIVEPKVCNDYEAALFRVVRGRVEEIAYLAKIVCPIAKKHCCCLGIADKAYSGRVQPVKVGLVGKYKDLHLQSSSNIPFNEDVFSNILSCAITPSKSDRLSGVLFCTTKQSIPAVFAAFAPSGAFSTTTAS